MTRTTAHPGTSEGAAQRLDLPVMAGQNRPDVCTDNAEVASSILASPTTKVLAGGHFHDWAQPRERSIHRATNRALVRLRLGGVGVRPGQLPVGAAACGPGAGRARWSYRDGLPRRSRLGHATKGDSCTLSTDADRRFGNLAELTVSEQNASLRSAGCSRPSQGASRHAERHGSTRSTSRHRDDVEPHVPRPAMTIPTMDPEGSPFLD